MPTPLIPFLLGLLAFAGLLLPEPAALAGVTLPNLWFPEQRFAAWDVLLSLFKVSGALFLTLAVLLQAKRWGWSRLRLAVLGGGAVLLGLLVVLALPSVPALLTGPLLLIIGMGAMLLVSPGLD